MDAIKFTMVPITEIQYSLETHLFPYSPRKEVDWNLVGKIKRSIAETGMWGPVIVREETDEGIAGNHRFLAYRDYLLENNHVLEKSKIPVMFVDCDEGMAVSIALIENEMRENLTGAEKVYALKNAAKRKPKTIETVFEIDGRVMQQLELWGEEMDYYVEIESRRKAIKESISPEWLAVLNIWLADHAGLREFYLYQLRNPSFVESLTLEDWKAEIKRGLYMNGRQFGKEKTWNKTPMQKCLNCDTPFESIEAKILKGEDIGLMEDGRDEDFCPFLRLDPNHIKQFVPKSEGEKMIHSNGNGLDELMYPEGAVNFNNGQVRGTDANFVIEVNAYCVDPKASKTNSCFKKLEKESKHKMIGNLKEQELPVVDDAFLYELRSSKKFFWQEPKRDGHFCTSENCLYADDEVPGYKLLVQPDGDHNVICIKKECGAAEQNILEDEKKRIAIEKQEKLEMTKNEWRRGVVAATLFSDEVPDLTSQDILEKLERVLVPDWDVEIMRHIVVGYGLVNGGMDQWNEYNEDEIKKFYGDIRESFMGLDEDRMKWVGCLVGLSPGSREGLSGETLAELYNSVQIDCI